MQASQVIGKSACFSPRIEKHQVVLHVVRGLKKKQDFQSSLLKRQLPLEVFSSELMAYLKNRAFQRRAVQQQD